MRSFYREKQIKNNNNKNKNAGVNSHLGREECPRGHYDRRSRVFLGDGRLVNHAVQDELNTSRDRNIAFANLAFFLLLKFRLRRLGAVLSGQNLPLHRKWRKWERGRTS